MEYLFDILSVVLEQLEEIKLPGRKQKSNKRKRVPLPEIAQAELRRFRERLRSSNAPFYFFGSKPHDGGILEGQYFEIYRPYAETRFSPSPEGVAAIEDFASCVVIANKNPGVVGISAEKYFLEIQSLNPERGVHFHHPGDSSAQSWGPNYYAICWGELKRVVFSETEANAFTAVVVCRGCLVLRREERQGLFVVEDLMHSSLASPLALVQSPFFQVCNSAGRNAVVACQELAFFHYLLAEHRCAATLQKLEGDAGEGKSSLAGRIPRAEERGVQLIPDLSGLMK